MRRQINFGFATLELGLGQESKTLTKDIDASDEFLRSNDFELGTKSCFVKCRVFALVGGDRPPKLPAFIDPNNLDRLRQLEDIVNTFGSRIGAALRGRPTRACHLQRRRT